MHSNLDDNPYQRPFANADGGNSTLHRPAVLAQSEGFGSVVLCAHQLVHVQVGFTTMTLTQTQYSRLVALLSDSAANLEFFRHQQAGGEDDTSE